MITSGSESSIVFSGGSAGEYKAFSDIIDEMDIHSNITNGNNFVFDTKILQSIPEFRKDYFIPSVFRSWHNIETEKSGHSWSILSLGPSHSGLPMHSHGATWLGIVYGAKRWFVYPPGVSGGVRESDFNPLQPVSQWLDKVLPQLEGLPKPSLPFQGARGMGFRPLECVQRAGQVLYLPNGWVHQTHNMGQTVAVGGQASWAASER